MTAAAVTTRTLPRRRPAETPRAALREVERILRGALANDEGPLKLPEVRRRMTGNASPALIRSIIDELVRTGRITESPTKGVMWTLYENPRFWRKKGLIRL